jgi:hypothetical protein
MGCAEVICPKIESARYSRRVQLNVKEGTWKCSGTISRNVLDTMGELVAKVRRDL